MVIFPMWVEKGAKSDACAEKAAERDAWSPEVFSLGERDSWRRWRQVKLFQAASASEFAPTQIEDPRAVSQAERAALLEQVAATNYALYQWRNTPPDDDALDDWLLAFTRSFGLRAREDHRSANGNGVVRIEVAHGGGRVGYIPYNYHGPDNCVRGMILHCAAAASEGGENRLLDHELAYLRLRDADETALRLLMHPQAMTIPEATDDAGQFRAANAGPVFFLDDAGALVMRYTARQRNVVWRDTETRAAADKLLALIEAEPLARRLKLAPGQGLLCNNVLHDRSAFEDHGDSHRRLCRIRFNNRINSV
jgi:alpha-ketoglutarate-dependent taurine dioxygenase